MKIKCRRNNIFYKLFRLFVCNPTLYLFYNFKVTGRENLLFSGPGFILAKHQSWVDLFIICSISPVPLYYVAKQEIFKNLFGDFKKGICFQLGRLMESFITTVLFWLGAVPLSRDNPKETLSSFKYMENLLEEKEIIVFFPEGRFVRDTMGEARKGLIKWLLKMQRKKKTLYPVINVGINYKKSFPRFNLTCHIASPEYYTEDLDEVTEKIMKKIKELSDL